MYVLKVYSYSRRSLGQNFALMDHHATAIKAFMNVYMIGYLQETLGVTVSLLIIKHITLDILPHVLYTMWGV